jgi:hypothetical protein
VDGKENGRKYIARKMGKVILSRRFVRRGTSK